MSAVESCDFHRPAILPDTRSWKQVVAGDALESQGMASFARYFTPGQAEAICACVATTARDMARK
jgi:hypothetical protein